MDQPQLTAYRYKSMDDFIKCEREMNISWKQQGTASGNKLSD